MNRWIKRLGVVAAIVVLGVVVKLTVFRAARGRVEETVANSKAGTVTARRRAKMSPQIGGQVAYLGARKGVTVKAGDVLLRIADRDLRANLDLARGEVRTAEATIREACTTAAQAERDVTRNESLKGERIVSDEILDKLRSTRDAANARCEASRAQAERGRASVALAEATLEKAVLRAPFDGIVADLKTEVGEWVSPSPAALPIPPVYDIIDPSSIYVSAPIDEVDAGRVRPGQIARVTLDPLPGQSFPAKVVRVAPYVQDLEAQNRTLEIEVEFDDAAFSRTLLPGTSADVEVILAAVKDVLRIPSYAILEGSRVLLLDGGVLKAAPVQVGMRNWEFAEVKGGLKDGDPVVVSLDRAEVKEGARAIEQEAQGTAAPGAAPAAPAGTGERTATSSKPG